LKNRDDKVIAFIVSKNMSVIEYMVYELGCGIYEAEDLFQEAFIVIIIKIDSDVFELKIMFSVYLYAVCKNLCKYQNEKEMQKERFFKTKLDDMDIQDFFINYDKELKEKIFIEKFYILSDLCQQTLKFDWLGYKVKEIAKKLGRIECYILKCKYKCKKRFVELIKRDI